MVTPEQIKEKAGRKFLDFLLADIYGESGQFFPLEIKCDKSMNYSSFEELDRAVSTLRKYSDKGKSFGYTVDWVERKTKNFYNQDTPQRIYFKSEYDFLKYIGREKDTRKFREIVKKTQSEFPELPECLVKYVDLILEDKNYLEWDSILKVCRFFRHSPKPEKFARELNMGVHTKFIERHTRILRPLLNQIVGDLVNEQADNFYERFNMKKGDPQISFRILDDSLSEKYFSGISYNTVFLFEFCKLQIPFKRVIIVENKQSLSSIVEKEQKSKAVEEPNVIEMLPSMKDTLVIWGSGYKVNILKEVKWLENTDLYYWGDMDVQGFEILYQIRQHFPHIKSLMMDMEALRVHPNQTQGKPSRFKNEFDLELEESQVYSFVKENNLRFEQEYLPDCFINACLNRIM